jgi:putative flippase GtrA
VDVSTGRSLLDRLRSDEAPAQFARFVVVGGLSNAVYALLFLALAGWGDQPAMVAGSVTSSVLANELHRRLTFHAGERVSWHAAQAEGGALVVVGMVLTGLALYSWDAVAGPSGALTDLAVIATVTAVVGLVRFAALRWLFRPPVSAAVLVRAGVPAPA